MPYQPVELTATIGCAAARTGGLLLSTVPPRPDPAALPLDGLRLRRHARGRPDHERGRSTWAPCPCRPATAPSRWGPTRPPPSSPWTATPVLRHPGDVRPDVAGHLHRAARRHRHRGRLALSLTADTRFTTTPSFWKIALAVLCLAGLVTLFVLLAAADRALPRVRILPRGWWRPAPGRRRGDGAAGGVVGRSARGPWTTATSPASSAAAATTASSATSTAGSTPPRPRSAGSTSRTTGGRRSRPRRRGCGCRRRCSGCCAGSWCRGCCCRGWAGSDWDGPVVAVDAVDRRAGVRHLVGAAGSGPAARAVGGGRHGAGVPGGGAGRGHPPGAAARRRADRRRAPPPPSRRAG